MVTCRQLFYFTSINSNVLMLKFDNSHSSLLPIDWSPMEKLERMYLSDFCLHNVISFSPQRLMVFKPPEKKKWILIVIEFWYPITIPSRKVTKMDKSVWHHVTEQFHWSGNGLQSQRETVQQLKVFNKVTWQKKANHGFYKLSDTIQKSGYTVSIRLIKNKIKKTVPY